MHTIYLQDKELCIFCKGDREKEHGLPDGQLERRHVLGIL